MKFKFSLSIKLTIIIVLLLFLVGSSLGYFYITEETKFFEEAYSEKAVALAQSLDVSITNRKQLEDKQILQNYILNFILINEDVKKVSINLPENDELRVVVSSDSDLIGTKSSKDNIDVYNKGEIVNIPHHSDDSHTLTVITPLQLSGQTAGTYEIDISMDESYAALFKQINNIIIFTIVVVLILIICFFYLLRRVLVKPIIAFRDAAIKVGKGDFDAEVNIKSRDELGELALAFNQMTSDIKKSRDEIEKYGKMQKKLLKQKDDFVNQLGHDLKNPLSPIINLVKVLKKRSNDKKTNELLDVILRNALYIKELVFNTLNLAKLNSATMLVDLKDIKISDVVNDVINSNKLSFKNKDINFLNNIDNNLIIEADELRMREVFDNITSNAIKFTDEHGLISFNAKKTDNDEIVVSVKDTGIGMNEEQLTHIFDEFYKADESRHDMSSSGLGLTICKKIIEKHGGKIWAESPGIGGGVTIYFSLPLSKKG